MSIPSVTVEATVGSGGAWEDISRYVIKDGASLTITRGRSGGGAAQPGAASFVLANGDGRFSESNPASPYAGFWKPTRKAVAGTGVRITVNGFPRFIGNMQSCPTTWPSHPLAVTTVTAVDTMARLAAAPVAATSADAVIAGLNPVVWFPLDEPAKSQVARDRVGSGTLAPVTVDGALPVTFGSSAPDGLRVARQVRLGEMQGRAPSPAGSATTSWTIAAIFTPDAGGVAQAYFGGTIGVGSPFIITLNSGVASASDNRGGGTTLPSVTVAAPGGTALVALSVSGTAARLVGTTSTATLASPISLSDLLNPASAGEAIVRVEGLNAGACHVFALPYAMTEDQYRATVGALLDDNDLAAPVSTILQPSIDAAGIDATVQVLGYDRFMLAPSLAQTPAAVGEQLAQAAGALYVADRATGDPTWIDHRYVGPVTEITARMIRRDGVTWGSDPIGTDSHNVPELMPEDVRGDYLRWLDNTADLMDAARLTGWQFDLARMADPDDIDAVLALDLKHRLRMSASGVPSQVPTPLRTMTLEGYTETISFPVGGGEPTWTLTPTTAPDPRGIYGDAVQGIAGATADNRYGY